MNLICLWPESEVLSFHSILLRQLDALVYESIHRRDLDEKETETAFLYGLAGNCYISEWIIAKCSLLLLLEIESMLSLVSSSSFLSESPTAYYICLILENVFSIRCSSQVIQSNATPSEQHLRKESYLRFQQLSATNSSWKTTWRNVVKESWKHTEILPMTCCYISLIDQSNSGSIPIENLFIQANGPEDS